MEDSELITTYMVGIFMLAFLDEYGKLERTRSFAKVYNTLIKKNGAFQKQINDFKSGKRKKVSHKAQLFHIATQCATISWQESLKSTKGLKISAGSAIANLYRLNEENFTRIFSLGKSEFQYISKQSEAGVTLSSCKMSRILFEKSIAVMQRAEIKKEEDS